MKILHELFKVCIALMMVSVLVLCGAMILVAFGVNIDVRLIMIAGITIMLSFVGALAVVQAEDNKLNGN
jgi:uncharacterized membrane protein